MRNPVKDGQSSFAGGLNLSTDYGEMGPSDLLQAQNTRLNTYGAAVPRWGTQKLHTTSLGSTTTGFAVSPTGATFTEIFIVVAGIPGHLYSCVVNTNLTAAVPLTFTDRGAIGNANEFSFAPFRDAGGTGKLYIAGGQGVYSYIFGGGAIAGPIAGIPAGISQLAVQNRRLFGITQQDELLYFSALDDGNTLGNAAALGGFAAITTFGQQDLRALLPLGDSLLLFHEHGVSRFTGWSQDDISIQSGTRGVSADTGTVASASVVSAGGIGYFASTDGFYRITEAGIARISAKVDNLFRESSSTLWAAVRGVHNKKYQEIWWRSPTATNISYAYNYALDAWTGPFTIGSVTDMWQGPEPSTDLPVVFFSKGGFVYRADYPALFDDVTSAGTGGNGIVQITQPRRLFFGGIESEKAIRRVYTGLRQAGTTPGTMDYATSVASGTVNLANPSPGIVARNEIAGRGTYLDLVYTFTSAGETVLPVLSSIGADAIDYGPRF